MRNDDEVLPAGSTGGVPAGSNEDVSAGFAATPDGIANELTVTHADGQTRAAVIGILVEDGPLTAGEIGERVGISAAGIRRHLDALVGTGDVELASAGFNRAGRTRRGRPAKWFQLTATGRGKLRHAYDDLAGAAMRRLRDLGGAAAVEDFARERVEGIVAEVAAADSAAGVPATVDAIANALTSAGYAANTRAVGAGMQICQHHCPVAHVAAEFPELCEAETAVFSELLGTHVQRLATIANGDCACTTHVPLVDPAVPLGDPIDPTVDTSTTVDMSTTSSTPSARDAQPVSATAHTSRKVSR